MRNGIKNKHWKSYKSLRNSPKVILSTCPEATGERPRKGPDSAPLSGCFCPESESRPWGPQSTSWDCSPPLAAARGDRHHPPPPLASDSPTGLRVCPETPKHTDPAWIAPVPRELPVIFTQDTSLPAPPGPAPQAGGTTRHQVIHRSPPERSREVGFISLRNLLASHISSTP